MPAIARRSASRDRPPRACERASGNQGTTYFHTSSGTSSNRESIPSRDHAALPLATFQQVRGTALRIGERVYAVGSPHGLERSISEGLVSGLPGAAPDTIIQTTAAISHGSSGGGLFDSSGVLIGITTLFLKDGQSLNFAVPADQIEMLQRSPAERTRQYVLPSG